MQRKLCEMRCEVGTLASGGYGGRRLESRIQ